MASWTATAPTTAPSKNGLDHAPSEKKLSRSDRTARAWPSCSSARVVKTMLCHGQPAARAPTSRARQTAAMVSPTHRACCHSPRAPPQLGRHPGRDHHPGAAAAGDGRAPARHIPPVRQQRIVNLGQRLDPLGHRPRFAGKGGLVDPQRPRLGQAQVGGEQVTWPEQHQIAGHHLGRGCTGCQRTIRTGRSAKWMTLWVTLPSSRAVRSPRP
jgi:hypothetical protein